MCDWYIKRIVPGGHNTIGMFSTREAAEAEAARQNKDITSGPRWFVLADPFILLRPGQLSVSWS